MRKTVMVLHQVPNLPRNFRTMPKLIFSQFNSLNTHNLLRVAFNFASSMLPTAVEILALYVLSTGIQMSNTACGIYLVGSGVEIAVLGSYHWWHLLFFNLNIDELLIIM